MPIAVQLIASHRIVRAGLQMLIEAAMDLKVLSEADAGEGGSAMSPDVIVIDLADAARAAYSPAMVSRIAPIILVADDPGDAREHASIIGAAAVVDKYSASETLVDVIRAVAGAPLSRT